ncbi:MAG: DUF3795 domain-containing protein [Patescibacteria group bacterium]|nr:DUF3795 domain-containing protein [Patescibacteria group bacterium]
MATKSSITAKLIAPCGMNCAICIAHLRDKNKCLGCRDESADKPTSCRKCTISTCEFLKKNKMIFCSNKCEKFPCARLKNLDKRYKTKYGMSMLENLNNIKKQGIRKFVKNEQDRWKCQKCKKLLCVHRNFCLECGEAR